MLQLLVIIIIIIIIIIVNKAKDDGRFGVVVGTKVKIPRVRDEEMVEGRVRVMFTMGKRGWSNMLIWLLTFISKMMRLRGLRRSLWSEWLAC